MPKYYQLITFINLGLFGLAFFISLFRYQSLDRASKIFCLFLGTSFAGECIALFCAYHYHNNIPVYAILNIIEMVLICLYFNYSITTFKKRHIGLAAGILSVIVGIINIVYFQSLYSINTLFLYYQGILIIAMSMVAMVQYLLNVEYMQFQQTPHFWIPALMLVFWVISFLNWAFYDFLIAKLSASVWMINNLILFVCMIMNAGYAIIFFFYPKPQKQYVG